MDSSVVTEVLGDTPILLMGVGYPDQTKNRRQHHKEDFKFPTLKKNISMRI